VFTLKRTILFLLSMSVLAACSTPSSSRYNASDVGRTIETSPGSVISSRIVRVSGDDSNVGPIAGGALGGAGAGWGFQSGWAAVIGAVVGAGAGYLAQDAASGREGIEYLVHMDDGRTVTLVQNRADEEIPLPDGTPVLVQLGGKYSRVVADPRGTSRSATIGSGRTGGEWVDPDRIDSPPSPSQGATQETLPSPSVRE
jgi:outer membrane lipoprotein SlyB